MHKSKVPKKGASIDDIKNIKSKPAQHYVSYRQGLTMNQFYLSFVNTGLEVSIFTCTVTNIYYIYVSESCNTLHAWRLLLHYYEIQTV